MGVRMQCALSDRTDEFHPARGPVERPLFQPIFGRAHDFRIRPLSAVCTIGDLVISHHASRVMTPPLVLISEVAEDPGWQT